jgi:hypothetical protein
LARLFLPAPATSGSTSREKRADILQVGQGSVAKIEKRADMYVSTLRRLIEAMGGELEIVARFADHSVKIRHFADLSEKSRVWTVCGDGVVSQPPCVRLSEQARG